MIKIGSLFSGIGGFELGLERAIPGAETIWQVEQNAFCQKVLSKHWPKAKIYNDVKNITADKVEAVDILCGGFPCQDISIAGKGRGLHGKKSGLWWEMLRIISELRPRIVILENVAAISIRGGCEVVGSLTEIGYNTEWTIISARAQGAPHLRRRWFAVAYPADSNNRSTSAEIQARRPKYNVCDPRNGCNVTDSDSTGARKGRDRQKQDRSKKRSQSKILYKKRSPHTKKYNEIDAVGNVANTRNRCSKSQKENYWKGGSTESPLCRVDDGISNRLDRLRSLGNAIVPQCSEWVGQQIVKSGLLQELS